MRRRRFGVTERTYRHFVEVAEARTKPRYRAGGTGRWRADSEEKAIRSMVDGLCGEYGVAFDVGGRMDDDVREFEGSDAPGDVLMEDGRWIEVRTTSYRGGVFGFHGDDPADLKAEICALVESSNTPLIYYLVGYATTEEVRAAVYQKDFGHGEHWVCDPLVFGEMPPGEDSQGTLF